MSRHVTLQHYWSCHARDARGGADPRPDRAQSTFLGGFLTDERLRRLVAEGALEFVLWDSTTECTDHLKCFQPVMYSHAVLAFWGANVYLCAPPARRCAAQDRQATPQRTRTAEVSTAQVL
jgi:hypothetical protein